MAMSVRVYGQNTNDTEGGEREATGMGIGGGKGVLLVLQATNTKTTVAAAAAAAAIMAANATQSRVGGKIVNAGSTTLHVEQPSGVHDVPPNGSVDVDDGYQGEIGGWWDGTPSGNAYVSEVTV